MENSSNLTTTSTNIQSTYNTALELITRAIQHDLNGRTKDALYLYQLALEYLERAFREDNDISRKENIGTKKAEYEQRVKVLKERLQTDSTTTVNKEQQQTVPELKKKPEFSSSNLSSQNLKTPPIKITHSAENYFVKSSDRPILTSKNSFSNFGFDESKHSSDKERAKVSSSPTRSIGHFIPKPWTKGISHSKKQPDFIEGLDFIKKAKECESSNNQESFQLYKLACENFLKIFSNNSEIKKDKSEKPLKDKTKKILIDFQQDEVILHERLGSGGSGASIYRCTISGITFAAKILKTDTVEETIDALKREIKIMEQLSHPNIVKYLAHDLTKPGELRLYLEYYSGTLNDVINKRNNQKNSFSLSEICGYIFQISKGLHYLHTLPTPIVHRDIKSENVFITLNTEGNVQFLKIGDFDTSKYLDSKKTFTKNTGTEGFMAPEVCSLAENQGYTSKADIWSLGMVMYELMDAEKPFHEIHPAARWKETVKGTRPQLKKENYERYQELIPLWEKLTDKNPEKRPSAKKIIQKLSEHI